MILDLKLSTLQAGHGKVQRHTIIRLVKDGRIKIDTCFFPDSVRRLRARVGLVSPVSV